MPLKYFCNSCQEYIRDVRPEEISSLRGTEICQTCEAKHSEFLKAVEKVSKRAINKINDAANRFQAEIEEAKRHIIKKEEKPDTTK